MNILVTGGAGFIGSHACKALSQAGYTPVVYDNLSTGHADAVRWGPLEIGDILDPVRLDCVFKSYQPALVLHFAGLSYVGESVIQPSDYYRANVVGTHNLLHAMRQHNIPAMVFSSSCAIYGLPGDFPVNETTSQNPISPYGFTKLVVERMLRDFEQAYGLRWIALRYFNAAGADPDGELGERHNPETHAIPLALQAALGSGAAFSILGTDYPTPDGSAVRDYVHVSDLADAHVLAARYLLDRQASVALNLGTGTGTSVLEMLAAVGVATQRSVPIINRSRRPGDPPILYASATLAGSRLGWRPRFRELQAIVDTAARWYSRSNRPATPPQGMV